MNHEYIDLQPVAHVQGTVRLPGSKSISNRILLLAALSQGDVNIVDLLASDDQQAELQARIAHSLGQKKQTHFLHQGNTGITQNLSFIGG